MLNLFNKKSAEATEKLPEEKKLKISVKDGTSPASVRGVFGGKGRRLSGMVVSDKMKKTVVVAISYEKKHPKYQKYYTVTNRFKAHDENNEYHIGDKVMIRETRPMSKEKRWVVISKA